MTGWTFDQMAARAATEVQPGDRVCLGQGLPQLVQRHLSASTDDWRRPVVIAEAHRLSTRGAYLLRSTDSTHPLPPSRTILLMEHVDSDGSLNLVEQLSQPGARPPCGQRIITDLAVLDVIEVDDAGSDTALRLVQTAPGVTLGWLRRWSGARIQRDGQVQLMASA